MSQASAHHFFKRFYESCRLLRIQKLIMTPRTMLFCIHGNRIEWKRLCETSCADASLLEMVIKFFALLLYALSMAPFDRKRLFVSRFIPRAHLSAKRTPATINKAALQQSVCNALLTYQNFQSPRKDLGFACVAESPKTYRDTPLCFIKG